MPPVFWSALLLLIGLGLVMVEIFVPSGGILGFLSFTSILAGIVLAYYHSGPILGTGFLIVACLAVPVVLSVAFRYLPLTPIGRRLLPSIPTPEEVLPDTDVLRRLRELVGRIGQAKSRMLPSGPVLVDGETIDAISEGLPIEAGQPVRVIEVRGNLVVVRPIDPSTVPQLPTDDPLSRPIESLGLDPFEDPLA